MSSVRWFGLVSVFAGEVLRGLAYGRGGMRYRDYHCWPITQDCICYSLWLVELHVVTCIRNKMKL